MQRGGDEANVEHGELQRREISSGADARRVAGGLPRSAVHINGNDNDWLWVSVNTNVHLLSDAMNACSETCRYFII